MYLIVVEDTGRATHVIPVEDLKEENVLMVHNIPPLIQKEGYAATLYRNRDGNLEWAFKEIPEAPEKTEEQKEARLVHTTEYQAGYDRAVLDMMEVEE